MEIIHIPEKDPIPPDQQPTVEVFAASIPPKLANTLIRCLNRIAPLESLRHVKRVHKKHQPTQGNTELWVILCLVSSQNSNDTCSFPHGVQELITSHQLTVFRTEVCKYAATSKEEWEEQCKLWPTSFHPPTYNIDGITGFSDEDSESIFNFMNVAIKLAKSGGGSVVNAAVIVDPSVKEVISRACDETSQRNDSPPDKNTDETSCRKQQENDFEGAVFCKTVQSSCLSGQTKEPFTGVSCLFPRGWAAEERPHSSSRRWHPLRHAALVAIESSAARDRRLFPISGEIRDEPNSNSSFAGSPLKKQKAEFEMVKGNGADSHPLATKPYLCTGYDIYLVWEPCPMCAMALVHQRIRRIFFAFPNTNTGALGSVYRLQGEKSLNHHYAVFRVLLPEPVFDDKDKELHVTCL